ncbi:hypothetical protein PVK06_026958 [Gossypium arboreum]|uniref:Uncharacterized protein n=1 Tax=Gossypium arboreum TaxID=29729 RepID=A0ABR0NZD0_GOSAR|nr:hypothetical protein PVK06_026958 [Gossypium arboreum]
MSKEEFEQRWARKSLTEMLSTVEERRDSVQELLDSQRNKLTERNDALEAMVKALKEQTMATTMALSTRIEELEGELALYRIVVGKGVPSAVLCYEDVLKLKEFMGTRFTCDVDNFLWRMENYFRAKGIIDDAIKINYLSPKLSKTSAYRAQRQNFETYLKGNTKRSEQLELSVSPNQDKKQITEFNSISHQLYRSSLSQNEAWN